MNLNLIPGATKPGQRKTTLFGIITLLFSVVQFLQGDLGGASVSVSAGMGLLYARDGA